MGKRHRQNRKVEKRRARIISLRYVLSKNELGELRRRHASKAEIRRHLIEAHRVRRGCERDIFDLVCERAIADIHAEEDARILKMLEEAIEEARPKSLCEQLTTE